MTKHKVFANNRKNTSSRILWENFPGVKYFKLYVHASAVLFVNA